MQARFILVVLLVFIGVSLLPLSVLSLTPRNEDDRGLLILFIGTQVIAISLLLRAVLLASLPQQDAQLRRRWRRWRGRGTAAGLTAGAFTSVLGAFLVFSPVPSGLMSILGLIALVILVWALDKYACHTATHHPVDAVRAGDFDRLAPEAVRATLTRHVTLGILSGSVGGVLIGMVVGLAGPGDAAIVWSGLAGLILIAAVVFGFGSISLLWAAGRRLNALSLGDHTRSKRVRKAITGRRVSELDEQDRRYASTWAVAAEPVLLLQLVSQIPMLVLVPGAQTALLVLDPDDLFRRWLVAGMLVLMVPTLLIAVRQWRIVRAFAHTSTVRT